MTKPTFLLGVGCQKGGSTWLYDHLMTRPEVTLSNPKELHLFDVLDEVPGARQRVRLARARIDKVLREAGYRDLAGNRLLIRYARRLQMWADPDEYLKYFRELSQPGIALVGEISPSYALLSADRYQQILSMMEPEFDVKVVFLMRDPIDRIISAMRMADDHIGRYSAFGWTTRALPYHRRFGWRYDKEPYALRSRYDLTIANLEKIFRPDQIHYAFYEEFLTPDGIAELSAFLGVSAGQPQLETPSNARAKGAMPSHRAIAQARQHYDMVYQYCADRFGTDRIKSLWRHA